MADFDLLRIEHMLRNPVEIAQPICEWLNEYWVGPLIMTARNDQEVVRIHYPMERMGFIDELLCFHHARSLQFRLSESLIEGFEPLILRLSPHWEKDVRIWCSRVKSQSGIRTKKDTQRARLHLAEEMWRCPLPNTVGKVICNWTGCTRVTGVNL